MKRLVSIAAVSLLTACASSAPKSADFSPGDAEAAIRRADGAFSVNARSGDARATVESFYAPDAVVMPPNMPALRGRDAILPFWTGLLASGSVEIALTPRDVVQSCRDLAVETGHYDVSVTPRGGQATKDAGKYIVVWKKIDGRWWATEDIFNSDMPLPPR